MPAVLNEAIPAAVRDVENEIKNVLLDTNRYTGNAASLIDLDVGQTTQLRITFLRLKFWSSLMVA